LYLSSAALPPVSSWTGFAPRLALVFTLVPLAGAAMIATGTMGQRALVAAMLVGLAAGAEVDPLAYMVSRYFGLRHYGSIYGLCFSAFGLCVGIGPVVTARIAEQS
jgi:MFS transporter, OFA family, oxalate/formate antiporter